MHIAGIDVAEVDVYADRVHEAAGGPQLRADRRRRRLPTGRYQDSCGRENDDGHAREDQARDHDLPAREVGRPQLSSTISRRAVWKAVREKRSALARISCGSKRVRSVASAPPSAPRSPSGTSTPVASGTTVSRKPPAS